MFKRLYKGFVKLWNEYGDDLKSIGKYLLESILWTAVIFLAIFLIIHFPIFLLLIPVYGLAMLFVTVWKLGGEQSS